MSIKQTLITASTAQEVFLSTGNNAITALYICNMTAGVIHFTLQLSPLGAAPTAVNTIYFEVAVTPGDTYVIDSEKLILSNTDKIFITVPDYTAGNIAVTASYVRI